MTNVMATFRQGLAVWASIAGGIWKNCKFRQISHFISEMIQGRATATMDHQYELIIGLSNGAISNDLEW